MCVAFGIVAVSLLLLGQFKTFLIWPLGLSAALLGAAIVYREFPRETITKAGLVASIFILVFTAVWAGANFKYSSQHVYTNRDPGVYAAGGVWLINHDRIQIPRTDTFEGEQEFISEASAGFGVSTVNTEEIYTQGAHLLPAFLGIAGRAGGDAFLFRSSPLFAAFALLALFGFARQLTRDKWAIIATVIFAFSLPVIYFSRDTYSEMLAATYMFSALTIFVAAVASKKRMLWALAGIATGATALTRVDAFLSMAGIILALFVYLVISEKKSRRTNAINGLIFLVATTAISVIGMLDLALLSSGYLRDLSRQVRMEMIVMAALLTTGIVAVVLSWRTKVFSRLDAMTKSWRAKWAAIAVVLICFVLASRPLWMISRDPKGNAPIKNFIEAAQAAGGVPLDGYRTYAEQTVNWLVWYIGPVIVLSALIGLAIVAYRAMREKDMRWLAVLSVVFGAAVVYLNNPSITPDQIWASRRFLPVILPGVVIFGVLGLAWLEKYKKYPWGMNGKVLSAILATLAIVGPFFVSYPFLQTRTYVPELHQIKEVCANLSDKNAIIWAGGAAKTILQPTRNFCNLPSGGVYGDGITKEQLATVAKNLTKKGYEPIVGVFASDVAEIKGTSTSKMKAISSIVIEEYGSTFTRPPRGIVQKTIVVQMGKINPDGSISSLDKK